MNFHHSIFFLLLTAVWNLNAQVFTYLDNDAYLEGIDSIYLNNLYNRVHDNPKFDAQAKIKLNTLPESLADNQGPYIKLILPEVHCGDLYFKASYASIEKSAHYWEAKLDVEKGGGNIDSCSCTDGQFNITYSNNYFYGEVRVDTIAYEFFGKNSVGVLARIDPEGIAKLNCGVLDNSDAEGELTTQTVLNARSGNPCPVTCLFLYNDELLNTHSAQEIRTRASSLIAQFNSASHNSKIFPEVRLSLAGVEDFAFFEDTDISEDVNVLLGLANAKLLRNQFEADLVVYLASKSYPSYNGFVASTMPHVDSAYAILNYSADAFTFMHEVAHMFEAQHTTSGDYRAKGYAHAHNFKKGGCWPFRKTRKTIVSPLGYGSTIPNFSNPQVAFKGKPTGETMRYNARVMKENACLLYSYRQSPADPSLSVNSPNSVCPCRMATATAKIVNHDPSATYTYIWSISYDGQNWTQVSATGPSVNASVPCSEGEAVFFRVVVSGPNNYTETAIASTNAAANQDSPCTQLHITAKLPLKITKLSTPTDQHQLFRINGFKKCEDKSVFQIINSSGNIVYSTLFQPTDNSIAEYEHEVYLEHPGIYFAIFTNCRITKTTKLIRL